MNPILENILSGFGIDVIFCSYLLVVILWAAHYRKVLSEYAKNSFMKRATHIFGSFIVIFLVAEVILRILWRLNKPSTLGYYIVVSLYYVVVLLMVLIVAGGFIFYGQRLYRNLVKFEDVNVLVKDRLRKVTA
jgi:hypothetical protein